MSAPRLTLSLLPERYGVCRIAPDAELPAWALAGKLSSYTRTPAELSIVCPEQQVPEAVQCQRGWRCLQVQGPLDFALVGILASLAGPLAQAGISIFTLSTYDTDYLLVPAEHLTRALETLRQAGHVIQSELKEAGC